LDKDKREKGEVSRRDFLVGAGAVVVGGAIGAGITYPLVKGDGGEVVTTTKVSTVSVPTTVTTTAGGGATVTTTVGGGATVTVPGGTKTVTTTVGGGTVTPGGPIESKIRGLGFGNFGRDSGPAVIDVRDGKMVRVRAVHLEDYGFDKDYMKPYSITVDGKTLEMQLKSTQSPSSLGYKGRVYSPNRIKYPLKRVDWEPGGVNVNPQNRGKSKYVRISWDEATDMIASEINRIQGTYGNFAILAQGDGHGEGKVVHGPHGCQTQLLRFTGPDIQHSYTVQIRTPDSWEGYYWGGKHMWGGETTGTSSPSHNYKILDCVDDIEMVIYTNDEDRTTGGSTGHGKVSNATNWWVSLGKAKNILLAPEFNYTAAAHDFKWIPVIPCQDGALHLAMQYIWITEGTYDTAYIEKATVGFDKYKAHVLGEDDGVPKTPEWAAPRCGVPEWHIKALAKQWAAKKTSVTGSCGAMMRGPYGTEQVRMYIATLAMQGLNARGRLARGPVDGLPSQYTDSVAFDRGRNPDLGARGLEENEVAKEDFRTEQFLPKTLIYEALLNPPISWYGTCSPKHVAADQNRPFKYPIDEDKGGTRIRMMWTDTPCSTTCWDDGFLYIKALRDPSIEFVLTEHPWMENDTLLSDIILPTTTRIEEYDIGVATAGEGWRCLYMVKDCIKPIGESKTDYEVSLEVAKKLEKLGGRYADIVDKYTWGGRTVEDWIKTAWEATDCEEKTGLTYEQFKEKDLFVWPSKDYTDADLRMKEGVTNSYTDIETNKLQTPTGKYEFESTFLLENFPDDRERPPVPHWIVGGAGWTHDEQIAPDIPNGAERCKIYPLLLESLHPKWRGNHAQCDDLIWNREIPLCKVKGPDGYLYEPLWINPVDAEPRGIKSGDVVSIYNNLGTVLGGAVVTSRICPGGVYQDHGARVDPINTDGPQEEFIDRGGANNLIAPRGRMSQYAEGQVCSGFLVEVKKTDLSDLVEKYPDTMGRLYDPAAGLNFDAWVEGGE